MDSRPETVPRSGTATSQGRPESWPFRARSMSNPVAARGLPGRYQGAGRAVARGRDQDRRGSARAGAARVPSADQGTSSVGPGRDPDVRVQQAPSCGGRSRPGPRTEAEGSCPAEGAAGSPQGRRPAGRASHVRLRPDSRRAGRAQAGTGRLPVAGAWRATHSCRARSHDRPARGPDQAPGGLPGAPPRQSDAAVPAGSDSERRVCAVPTVPPGSPPDLRRLRARVPRSGAGAVPRLPRGRRGRLERTRREP